MKFDVLFKQHKDILDVEENNLDEISQMRWPLRVLFDKEDER